MFHVLHWYWEGVEFAGISVDAPLAWMNTRTKNLKGEGVYGGIHHKSMLLVKAERMEPVVTPDHGFSICSLKEELDLSWGCKMG